MCPRFSKMIQNVSKNFQEVINKALVITVVNTTVSRVLRVLHVLHCTRGSPRFVQLGLIEPRR